MKDCFGRTSVLTARTDSIDPFVCLLHFWETQLAQMALKIEKFQSPGKGNGLRATAPMSLGELLYIAEPFTYVVNESSCGEVCEFCLRESTPLLRCSRCKFAKYCDKHCQIKGWPDHKQECRCLQNFEIDKKIHIVRFVGRIIFKLLQKKPCPSEYLNSVSELVSNYYNDDNTEMRSISDGYADRLCLYLKNGMPDPSQLSTNLNFSEHFCKVFCNQILIYNESNEEVAVGLYPSLSLVNHSCDPNCALAFDGTRIRLLAIKEVQAGEELTISYIDLLAPTRERRIELKHTFCFECDCHRCQTRDMDEIMLAGDKQASEESKDLVSKLKKMMERPENWDECLALCTAQLRKNGNRLPDTNIYQHELLCFAMKYCCIFKMMKEALNYGLQTLGAFRLYHDVEIQRAYHIQKVCMLQFVIGNRKEAMKNLREALSIVKIFCGPDHRLTQSLMAMHKRYQ